MFCNTINISIKNKYYTFIIEVKIFLIFILETILFENRNDVLDLTK